MTLDSLVVIDEDCRDGLHQYCMTYYCDCPCHGYPEPKCMCTRCQDIRTRAGIENPRDYP